MAEDTYKTEPFTYVTNPVITAYTGQNIAAALLKVQEEIGAVEKAGNNPHFKSTYAELSDVIDAVKPLLNKHGIVFLQYPVAPPMEGHLALETLLVHTESGETLRSVAVVPLVKEDPQAYGSAVTYARRYVLVSILGLKAVDDDGERAMGRGASNTVPPKPSFMKRPPADTGPVDAEPEEDKKPEAKAPARKKTSLFPKVKTN